MRVLTFGWDFPPVKNGGLGVACHGLTNELRNLGVEVLFVLPRQQKIDSPGRFIFADIEPADVRFVEATVSSYQQSSSQIEMFTSEGKRVRYGRTMLEEVRRYAIAAAGIARRERFDIIHAHDWTSYLAGLAAKRVSGRPLIVHVHATSFDQAGGDHADPEIYAIERETFAYADRIVTVSNYTKDVIVRKHGADPAKVEIVHNGGPTGEAKRHVPALAELKALGKKIVLYNGRITIQKGVDYFIRAARKVVDVDPDVVFVISGWGDMERQMMHLVGALGLGGHVIFAGSLWDDDRDRMYQSADLLVMPSVSEPFGLVPLEAIHHGTPALISKQSGVSEVLSHVLKVDFWDVDEMANKILASLRYSSLSSQLIHEGKHEVLGLSWRRAADKMVRIYSKMLDWFAVAS